MIGVDNVMEEDKVKIFDSKNKKMIKITKLANHLKDLEKFVKLEDIKELYKDGNDLVIIRKGLSDIRIYGYFD